MIAVENLSIRQGAFSLGGVTFQVPSGQYAVLMGKTGTGKTTILEAIGGLRPLVAGSIRLADRDVSRLSPGERNIGYVPQDLALFHTMTVREHLAFALAIRKWDRAAIAKRVDEQAQLLGIGHLLDRYPARLSGGEAQRVALGRALALHPPVLLLDEPLSALDEDTREEMYELLRAVREKAGATVLHVTHSKREAQKLADRVYLLEEGKVREATAPLPGSTSRD